MVQESCSVGRTGGRVGGGGEICSICLEPISGEGFLDQCFPSCGRLDGSPLLSSNSQKVVAANPDKFCYHCILQWSEMVISRPSSSSNRLQYLECPLCKTQYTSIIHDVTGTKFQRHYILTSRIPGLLKSEAHIRRQAVYSVQSEAVSPQPSGLTDIRPKPNRWVSCWVQRELQALMQEEDVDTVMHYVVGIVESFNKRSRGKVDVLGKQGTKIDDLNWRATIAAAVRPFIFEYAERFAVELESFLVSGLDIAAYDQKCKLATCAAEAVAHSEEEITIPPLKKDLHNVFDLYDEDVDEGFDYVMVRRGNSEVVSFSAEESSETVKQQTRQKGADIQEAKFSRKELTMSGKTRKDSIRVSAKEGGSNLHRSRSKQKSESRRKRRRSPSSSSRSSSPPKHKRRKREKIHSRKKRSHKKRKDKKASQEQKRKSHKSRSRTRKKNHVSSDRSSGSDNSMSSRSLSPAERATRRKAFAEKHVSEKADDRTVQMFEVENEDRRIRDQRKGPHTYSSSASEPRDITGTDRSHGSSPETLGKDRQPSRRGNQEFEGVDRIDADERSFSRSPETRFSRRHVSTSTSPRASAGRYSWDAREFSGTPSPKAVDDTLRVLSEFSGQRSDVGEEDADALELKLREQALANLMKHLSQKKQVSEAISLRNPEGNAAVATAAKNFGVSSASRDMKPESASHSKNLADGGQENIEEINTVGSPLEVNFGDVTEDVKQVEEGGDDTLMKMEFRPTKDGKGRTGCFAEPRSSPAVGEVIFEGKQSIGVPHDKESSLEGRDIVVELVVDTEPFDCDISYRGSTSSLVVDDQRGKRKDTQGVATLVTKVNGREDQLADGKIIVQQVDDDLVLPETQYPLKHREERVLVEKLSDVDGSKCRQREELALENSCSSANKGEPTPNVENIDHTDVAAYPEESGKTIATNEMTRSDLTGMSRPEASQGVHNNGDGGGDAARFQQKSMSVTRGGESVQVSYKVYIPQRPPGARRRLQR